MPITLAGIANQVVCVCAYLTNFKPPPHEPALDQDADSDVDDYFAGLSNCEDFDEEQSSKNSDNE